MAACSDTDSPEPDPIIKIQNIPLAPMDTVRVLIVGNSYSQDCVRYVDEIMNGAQVNPKTYCVYIAFQSSSSLHEWHQHLIHNDRIELERYAGQYTMKKTAGTLRELFAQDWDVITFQQVSGKSPFFDTFNPALERLALAAKDNCTNPRMSLAWHQVWRYWSQLKHEPVGAKRFEAICYATQQMVEANGIDIIIPSGTAIENARHTSLQTPHDLTRDGIHLMFGPACYVTACTFIESIFKPTLQVEVLGNPATHDLYPSEKTLPDYPEEAVPVTASNNRLCQQCAVAAVQNPYEVTSPLPVESME